MPNRPNSQRGGSVRCRDIPSEQSNGQANRSLHNLDSGHGSVEEPHKSAATLAASNGALQRLAKFAQYFESTFTPDLDTVEGAYERGIARENEIQRLYKTVETLTYTSNEEMENLREENYELKAAQDACEKERERCRTMESDLEARHAKAETARKEEFDRMVQNERTKAQKQLKVKKAEIEAESKQRVQELEDRNRKLSTANEELNNHLSERQAQWEKKKSRHRKQRELLEQENEKLTLQLEQTKSEFTVEGHHVEHYQQNFQQISDDIKSISSKYFQKLPERATTNRGSFHEELIKLNPIFHSMPIGQTEVSEFLRLRNVEHVISTSLCDFIWQPFFTENIHTSDQFQGVRQFLDLISKSLSAKGGRRECVWRALTLQGIDALGHPSTNFPHQVDSVVPHMLEALRPLADSSDIASLEKDLSALVNNSVTLWNVARKDEARFIVDKHPALSDQNGKWQTEDVADLALDVPPDAKIDISGFQPLCLFPSIMHLNPSSQSEAKVICRGSALLPDSPIYIWGKFLKEQEDATLQKVLQDADSTFNARRLSMTAAKAHSGANSPTAVANSPISPNSPRSEVKRAPGLNSGTPGAKMPIGQKIQALGKLPTDFSSPAAGEKFGPGPSSPTAVEKVSTAPSSPTAGAKISPIFKNPTVEGKDLFRLQQSKLG